jgi:hypothetical protein
MEREDAVRAIYQALERTNALREPPRQLVCSEDTILYGVAGALESLELVSLLVDVEEVVGQMTGKPLVLADEKAMSLWRNPFRDVRSLADYVMQRVGEGTA